MLQFRPPLNFMQKSIRVGQLHPRKLEDVDLYYLRAGSPKLSEELLQLFRTLSANEWEAEMLMASPSVPITLTSRNELTAKVKWAMALKMKIDETPSGPACPPLTRFERDAHIYREGEVNILIQVHKELSREIKYMTQHDGVMNLRDVVGYFPRFQEAVESVFGDLEDMPDYGTDDIVFIIGICKWWLQFSKDKHSIQQDFHPYFESLTSLYPMDKILDDVESEELNELYGQIFPTAAEVAPNEFGSREWTLQLLAWGKRVYLEEVVRLPNTGPMEDHWIVRHIPVPELK